LLPDDQKSLVAWSVCTEPGDEFAGFLRQSMGASKAMSLVLAKDASLIAATCADLGLLDAAVARFGDPGRVASDALERWVPRLNSSLISQAIAVLGGRRFRLVAPGDACWPEQLEALGWGAPAALWVAGKPEVLSQFNSSVALVGSRTPTSYGHLVTQDLVSGLADNGYAVVSGGAFGIDAIAHEASAALDNPTVAIMAGGLDKLYPSANRTLLENIAEKWAIISEMPPGTSPTKWRFLQRNRLIAAMSAATVVVEAGWRSGSINTANHATSIDRPVGAVPGPITSPASAGCHRLIKEQVAQLVTSVEDIREMLGESNALFEPHQVGLGPLEKRALDALGRNWQSLELVASRAGLTLGEARLALTSLELDSLAVASLRGWRQTGSNL